VINGFVKSQKSKPTKKQVLKGFKVDKNTLLKNQQNQQKNTFLDSSLVNLINR
jgi:hypothetical protein